MKSSALFPTIFLAIALSSPAFAFTGDGCGGGECKDCHGLELAEAVGLLQGMANTVESTGFAEIPGLFQIWALKDGNRFPLFLDFSKTWVLQANVARVSNPASLGTSARTPVPKSVPKPMTVDLGKINLDGPLVVGDRSAPKKVVVFTDPQCPYCVKLHEEMKTAVVTDPSVAFFIKMMPLKSHPGAYDLCKSVVCAGTLTALEEAMTGKKLPPATCDGKELDETIAFIKANGITSTPTLVLPDGKVVPGFRKAGDILSLLNPKTLPGEKKTAGDK